MGKPRGPEHRPPRRGPGSNAGRKQLPPPPTNAQPWERTATETLAAFEKFCRYRDTPASSRSLKAVGLSFGCGKSNLARLSRVHHWIERVAAYDAHLDRIAQAARATAVSEMNRRQAGLGQTMQAIAARAVSTIAQKAAKEGEAFTLPPVDIARLAVHGAQIERRARGEATEIVGDAPPAPAAPQETGRDLTRRIVRNPAALRAALELDRALEADAGSDGGASLGPGEVGAD